MAINLSKGQKVTLDKGVQFALAGLGWDVNQYDNGQDFDLDASVFLLNASDKLATDKNFVFYNNLEDASKAVKHTGDNRTGAGDGDDEKILIDFTKIPADVHKLAFVVTIHDAETRKQNFGMVKNAYIRLVRLNNINDTNGVEELRFDLSEDYSTETAMLVAEVYRHNNEWKFAAIGSGYKQGLDKFVKQYGGEVA